MNQQNPNFEGALSWDSEIKKESSFVLLEPGEYDFRVEKMERSTYNPSPQSKIRDSSPMAELELKIDSPEGTATVFENLILHSVTEFKISEFFTAIGQKKKGIPFTPNWSAVIGATGRAEIEVNEYSDRNGNKKKNNRVTNFLEPKEGQQQQAQTPQQPATPQQQPTQPQQNANPVQPQQNQPQANPGFNF